MTIKKEDLLKKVTADFDKNDGGTKVDPDHNIEDADSLQQNLQKSFDNIFPELLKKSKHRKHVIFDDDVYEKIQLLTSSTKISFSPLINSLMRKFLNKMVKDQKSIDDPVQELLQIRERERELVKSIKVLNLEDELNDAL